VHRGQPSLQPVSVAHPQTGNKQENSYFFGILSAVRPSTLHRTSILSQMGGCASKAEEPAPPPPQVMRRRASAAAQGGINPNDVKVNLATLPKIIKSDEQTQRCQAAVAKNVLCNHLIKVYKDAVIASMKEVKIAKDEVIIKQGDLGDYWYVLDVGSMEVFKKYGEEEEPKKVNSYKVGDSFGELALMFNQRRAASVKATEDSICWAVDQATFRALMLTAANANKATYS
jgi:hypothetical protein